jgi:hypothetical protein
VFAVAGELAVDADQSDLVIDVGPGEAEHFADPQARVGASCPASMIAARFAASAVSRPVRAS